MKLFYAVTFLYLLMLETGFATAKISVSAIVGEEIITTYDIEQRLKIFAASSNVKVGEQNRRALLQQTRELLIVEKLKIQAAEGLSITVTDAELTNALAEIASGNGVNIAELSEYIEGQGLSFLSVYNRIKAELLWQKLIMTKITPQINVSEVEVEESERIYLIQQTQVEVKYDFLAYKFNDAESKKLAEELSYKIYNDFVSNKLDFANVKNSERSTAPDVNQWEDIGKLKPSIQAYLDIMQAGEISEPFVSDAEILIVKLIAKREVEAKSDLALAQKIRQDLFMSKLENQVASYLRDVESSYYIERKKIL